MTQQRHRRFGPTARTPTVSRRPTIQAAMFTVAAEPGPRTAQACGLPAGQIDTRGLVRRTAPTEFGPLQTAQAHREQALATLDAGRPRTALTACRRGLATLEKAALDQTRAAVALLLAMAEIEECLGRIDDARTTATAAMAILDVLGPDGDERVVLWCQAQERLAALDRLSDDPGAACIRLGAVRDRAVASFGEASYLAERASCELAALGAAAAARPALV